MACDACEAERFELQSIVTLKAERRVIRGRKARNEGERRWIEERGDGYALRAGRDGKESTNGTWYYLNQEQPIQDGMIFKQNQTFFVANFV